MSASAARDGGAGEGSGSRGSADLGGTLRSLLDGVGEWASAAASEAAGAADGGPSSTDSSTGENPGSGADARSGQIPPGPAHTVSTCGVCPICLGLAALSKSHPEVLGHLSDAAQSLLAAIAAMAQATAPDQPAAPEPDPWSTAADDGSGEQRINVSE